MAFDFSYPNTPADQRGWGPGWTTDYPASGSSRPSSYPGTIVTLGVAGCTFIGGVRSEIHDLLVLLIQESLRRLYIPKLDDPGCYGLAFRATKRSDGTFTTTPSNHSWGLAVDINAPHNVYGSSTHQIPQAMADLWKTYGFRWLGPPIKDWMHFDFAGTPADAGLMTIKAVRDLTTQEDDDVNFGDWHDGWTLHEDGKPAPADPGWKAKGWHDRARLLRDANGGTQTISITIPAQTVEATVTGP